MKFILIPYLGDKCSSMAVMFNPHQKVHSFGLKYALEGFKGYKIITIRVMYTFLVSSKYLHLALHSCICKWTWPLTIDAYCLL